MDKLMTFSRKNPLIVMILMIAAITASIMNIGKVWLDSSSESMMMAGDPELNYYHETLEKFGSDNMMMIYVKDPDLFSVEKLKLLEQMVVALKNGDKVPGVQRVESLFSVNNIKGYPDYLDNNPLMDYPPETEEEAGKVKEIALSNPVFIGNLISEDGEKTVINLYLKPTRPGDRDTARRTQEGVQKILYGEEGFRDQFQEVFEIGNPYMSKTLTGMITKDMTTLMPISFLVLMLMLIITTGSITGAVLPFITSSLSIIFTFGFMGALGLPLNLLTFIVPILVIVIGSTEDVHILTEYQAGLIEKGERKLAIRFMSKTIGTALLLTSLTTFLGFMSIALNKVIVLIQFGIIAGFALLVNPLTTCMISPIYLSFFGSRIPWKTVKKKEGAVSRSLRKLADFIVNLIKKHKTVTLIVLLAIAAVLAVFSVFIKVDNDPVSYFKSDSELIRRMRVMHEELSGAQTFFIRISRDVREPEVGRTIEEEEPEIFIDETPLLAKNSSSEIEDEIFIDDTPSDEMGEEIFVDESPSGEMGEEILIDDSPSEEMDEEILIDDTPSMVSGEMEEELSIDDEFADEIVLNDFAGEESLPETEQEAVSSNTGAAISNTNLFKDPRYLRLVADIQFILDARYNFDKTISIATYIKMMHREMNVGQPGNYDMTPDPEDPLSGNLIAQYAMNLHHDQIATFVTPDWSEANILVRHNITSSDEIKKIILRLNREIQTEINKVDPYMHFKITGENILVNKAADSIAISQVSGLILLLAFILIIMSILFTNIKAGLLSLVPNLFPIAIYLGIMGIFRIPLNIGTCMVAAIAIGISVDDTIHFMTRYNHEMRLVQNKTKALESVIHAEIKPIISTSVALTLGFVVLALSNLIPILYFGILSAVVMVCALLADLLITPILLTSIQLTNLSDMAKLKLTKDLTEAPVFEGMSMWQIKKFALMGKVMEKEAGEYITRTGEVDRQMYILLEGSVSVQRFDEIAGKSINIVDLEVGSLIGEIALLRQCSRTADVVAKEPVKYLAIDWEGLKRIQSSSKIISMKLYHNMARILGQRLVNMTDKLEQWEEGRGEV